jgi:hypothetical protein
MKKLIITLVVVMFTCISITYAQEGIKTYSYCELVGYSNLLGTKVTIEINFGQKNTIFSDIRLKDENGKPIKFNSMIDAINYMGLDGWDFAQAYYITSGNQNIYHYLLKKEIILNKEDVEKRTKDMFPSKE